MPPKPLTLRMQYAAMRSTLPKEARHLVHVLSVLANSETGEGWHGQETIARLMGCSDRHVRTLLAVLEAPNGSGIRIQRRARFHHDGRGRTSDFWKLVSDADLPEEIDTTNRNTVPPEHCSTGTPRRTNRNAVPDQPEHGSGDLRSDLRSERRSRKKPRSETTASVAPLTPEAPKGKPRKQKSEPAQPGVHELKLHYVAEHERLRGRTPVHPPSEWQAFMAAFASMLNLGTLEAAKRVITHGLPSDFYQRPTSMLKSYNALLDGTPGSGRKVIAPQPMPSDATFLDDGERRAEELAQKGSAVAAVIELPRAGGAK